MKQSGAEYTTATITAEQSDRIKDLTSRHVNISAVVREAVDDWIEKRTSKEEAVAVRGE